MFDSQFDEIGHHQFPKTDINFYMISNNSSSLQPWNKTTYVVKPDSKKIINTIKLRNKHSSFDYHQNSYKIIKRRDSQGVRCQVPISTHVFNLEEQNSERSKSRKNNTANSVLKPRKIIFTGEKVKKQIIVDLFRSDNLNNKGFTNHLKHANLLKLKHEYQNRIKQEITKKEMQNKTYTPKLNSLQKRHSIAEHQNIQKLNINEFQIHSQQLRFLKTNDLIRKPKKAFYVGVRKFLCNSQEKSRDL